MGLCMFRTESNTLSHQTQTMEAVSLSCYHPAIARVSHRRPHRRLRCSFSSFYGRTVSCKRGLPRILPSFNLPTLASLEFVSPPVDFDLHSVMKDTGARFSENGVIESFGNDEEALHAVNNGVAVVEMSHVGRLRVSGDDRIRFLHNQSTADFQSLSEGQGCDTVFVTPTARTIDLSTAWIMKRAVILFVSPNMRESISKLLNKYIFFADKVEIEDITQKTFFLTILGPKSDLLMEQLNMKDILGKPYGTHLHYAVDGTPVTLGVGNLLSKSGYSLMLSTDTAGLVWEALLKFGAVPMGAKCWEYLRIQKGRPAPGKELTDEFNVLEAGLWDTISLSKGCYIGQETVARLVTYQGVRQHLWGLDLDGPVDPGSPILLNGAKVGKVTSCTSETENGKYLGLGYISKKAGGLGLQVQVGKQFGEVKSLPFISQTLSK